MAENWDVVICVINPNDLGDVEDNLLILTTDTSAAGAFDVRGKLGFVNISNGRIKDQLGPTRPRRITFKVGNALFNGRVIRFADGSGLMWGHVKRPKTKVADEDAVWVATKGSGGIVDLKSQQSRATPRKAQKETVSKKRKKASAKK